MRGVIDTMEKESILKHVRGKEWILLFLVSLGYILFFTECVPFFFDDHEFHRDYVATSYKDLTLQLFSLNKGGISDGPRPVYGFFFKTLFPFIGYNYCQWRAVKAVVFSIFIILFYFLAKNILQRNGIAFLCTLFIMTLFPTFLQQFGYNGPHIFAELFKISAILLFLYDLDRKKTSWLLQAMIFFCSLGAIRIYSPAYSIAAILPVFTVLYGRKKIIRYLPLFFFILLIQFPITFQLGALSPDSTGTYSPKLINIKRFITNDFWQNITNPIPTLELLYYKSVTDILTFFGFWLIVGCIFALILIHIKKNNTPISVEEKDIHKEKTPEWQKRACILATLWFFSELPYYIFLPEHAIRYSFAMFIPFSLLVSLLIIAVKEKIQKGSKVVSGVIILLLFGTILTNIVYVSAFRAGWGSSFFAFEKGMDYFAAEHNNKTIAVLYASGAVAEEYFYINKSSNNYTFGMGITYIKSISWENFNEETVADFKNVYDEVYVIKRITSLSKIGYPDVPLENYNFLELETVLEGTDQNVLFDRIISWFVSHFGLSYEPNKIFIYKYVPD
jgi:hypothetical protein